MCASALRIHCVQRRMLQKFTLYKCQSAHVLREKVTFHNLSMMIPGFICWTDGDGNNMRVYEPPERTMTNLLTASFTFSLTGLRQFLLFNLKRDHAPFPYYDYQDACR